VQRLERELKKASERLDFERAAELRDRLRFLKQNRVFAT
jgi:protein-arginine kinase activator protein McsA